MPGKDDMPPDFGLSARPDEALARARISRAVNRAWASLLWERIWPRLAPLVTLAAFFVTLSWFGLWRFTPTPVRYGLLAGFAVAALFYLWRLTGISAPTHADALRRVEAASATEHHPATAFSDTMAAGAGDPAAERLWEAHRRRTLGALRSLKAGAPSPRLDRHDPYAIRFLVALLFVVGFITAGHEGPERVAEAFRGGESAAATVARIDAWVTPPAYTNRAPIFLTGEAARPEGATYRVPAGSVVTVRTGGARDLAVAAVVEGTEAPLAEGSETEATDTATPAEFRTTLTRAATVVVRKGERDVSSWAFVVQPDLPPTIAFAADPKTAQSGALQLAYTLKDDYGVIGAHGEFESTDATGAAARPLYDAPALPLSLPQLRTRDSTGETTRDLTAHPWAGAKVRLTLVARDEAAQEGRSAPIELTLPARRFHDPLARAVVEQRTRLAMDGNAVPYVAEALDALTLAPEKSFDNVTHYLALRTAYHRLNNARDDKALRDVVDYLWTIAMGIEDGGLSLAADALRDAQEALRQALENNAPDEEIARLTQELREAMQAFMQAMAEEAMRTPNRTAMPPDASTQLLRQQDLERMLDQIEQLAATGARDAARQMLSELQNMMENLQAGRPQPADPQQGQMMESLNQLGDMIRRQEDLMNRTFRAERGTGEDGQEMPPGEMEQRMRELQEGQQALAEELQQLMQQMQGFGMEPSGKLGQAGDSMGQASDDLGRGDPGGAVGNQSSALDALRQGAQGMMQQLAEQMGQGGQGTQTSPGGMRPGPGYANEDPLGRPQRQDGPDFGSTVRVPDEIDTQRAREILDAIRERLGEAYRPAFEREYLERLLDRF